MTIPMLGPMIVSMLVPMSSVTVPVSLVTVSMSCGAELGAPMTSSRLPAPSHSTRGSELRL